MIIDSSEQGDEGDDVNRIMLQALMSCMTSYSLSLSQNSVCGSLHFLFLSFFFPHAFIFLFLFPSHRNLIPSLYTLYSFTQHVYQNSFFVSFNFPCKNSDSMFFLMLLSFSFFIFFILNQMMILSFIHHTLYNVNSQYLIQFIIHFISSLQTSFDVSSFSDFFSPWPSSKHQHVYLFYLFNHFLFLS